MESKIMIRNEYENKHHIKKYDQSKDLTKQELDEVYKLYKLRYSVYVEELNYENPHADHISKIDRDPLDSTGQLFGFIKNGETIGTVLTNYAKISDLGNYPELYNMHELDNGSYFDSSISTKLIVRRDYRATSIAFRLACATYIQQIKDNLMYSFVDCARDMVYFYLRLGYKVHQNDFFHPVYGDGVVLVLELQNIEHLEKCKSPFAKYYRQTMNSISSSFTAA